ncbi:MAG TPA: beta-propeller fold lactonase family protein [Anaeromyxobacteraceae bacterium]|nr:beta-propeller fold lactonase family protein [Anaeromyxobacteraceae bacterium]
MSTKAIADGAVFTISDDAAANAVVAFSRAEDGALRLEDTIATGGRGSGGGEGVLGSQGAVVLTTDGRFLLVVDAGSDEITAFRVEGAQLTRASRASSGGSLPVSIAEHDGLVYVLDAGGVGNIAGLRLDGDGILRPIAGSSRPLSTSGAGGAQIAFDASGEVLVVTEKASRTITTYRIDDEGRASGPHPVASAGSTPFGFAITRRDVLAVSEAGEGAVSSYQLDDGRLELVSGTVADGGAAPCWVVVTWDGSRAFVANAGSGTVASYLIDRHGGIKLRDGSAGVLPGGKPLDLALTARDRFLYVLDANQHSVHGFIVGRDGSLAPFETSARGLPPNAVGLASR